MRSDYKEIRKTFIWRTSGKSGKDPIKYVHPCDITDEHLKNILIWIKNHPKDHTIEVLQIFESEIEYRKLHNISIAEEKLTFEKIINNINDLNGVESKPVENIIIKFNEEFGEFCAEIIKMNGHSYKSFSSENLFEEAADSLQCLLSIILKLCDKYKITFNTFLEILDSKNKKWTKTLSMYTNIKK